MSPNSPLREERALTPAMRRYLVAIHRLSTERFPEFEHSENLLPTAALVDQMLQAPAAVGRMVQRLKKRELLIHQRYRGLKLTEAGERAALRVLRRRRIAEAFLVAVMDYDWSEVGAESQLLAEGMSEALAQRMWERAGQPERSPLGEPIPSEDGRLPPQDDHPLKDAEVGHSYRITRVRTDESDRLQYLAALGLRPRVTVAVLQVAPFDGPLQLRLGPEYRIIGDNLARMIFVRPLAADRAS